MQDQDGQNVNNSKSTDITNVMTFSGKYLIVNNPLIQRVYSCIIPAIIHIIRVWTRPRHYFLVLHLSQTVVYIWCFEMDLFQ